MEPSPINKLSSEEFARIVAESRSYSEITIKIYGHRTNPRSAKKRIAREKLDTSHLRGQHWANGLTFENREKKLPDEQRFVKGSSYKNQFLKKLLLDAGDLQDVCVECGIGPHYDGLPLTLQLDHINGDKHDNRKENLRILCPNCHSQTDTWCRINKYKPKKIAT
jgi:hypothetical protein